MGAASVTAHPNGWGAAAGVRWVRTHSQRPLTFRYTSVIQSSAAIGCPSKAWSGQPSGDDLTLVLVDLDERKLISETSTGSVRSVLGPDTTRQWRACSIRTHLG